MDIESTIRREEQRLSMIEETLELHGDLAAEWGRQKAAMELIPIPEKVWRPYFEEAKSITKGRLDGLRVISKLAESLYLPSQSEVGLAAIALIIKQGLVPKLNKHPE